MNKMVQDLKMEIETIKKLQKETTLEIKNLRKRTGTADTSITNRIQEMEERILGIEDTIEDIDLLIRENTKCKELLNENIQEIQDIMQRSNLRIGILSSKGQNISSTKS